MSLIDGGEVLVRALKGFDVDTMFTLHGGHLDSALRAASRGGIRLIDTRHEQAAGLAAIGWSRATGKAGVVMTTAGAGISNLVTAVANATADAVPLVALGGAPAQQDFDALPVNSGFDQLGLMDSVAKWSHRVTHLELLPEMVARAFQIARSGRPGPVYLDLPADVMFARVEENDLHFSNGSLRPVPPAPSQRAVVRTIEILKAAERPVIFAGGGVTRAGAADKLLAFAERADIPVLTNNSGRGNLPTDHRLYGGGYSAIAAAAARGKGKADVVLILGGRLGLYTGGRRTSVIPDDAIVIQVDIQGEEIGRLRDIDLGIVADCGEMLDALLHEDHAWSTHRDWVETLCGVAQHTDGEASDEPQTGTITPVRLAQEVAESVHRDAVLIADGGETAAWFDGAATTVDPRHWFGHGYVGVMGEGMPLSVGAQLAHPNSQVVVLVGDGAVGFNFAEFDTMVRHGLPVVVVVNNDQQWGMSAHGQDLLWGPGHNVATQLHPTRYDLAAAGFGAYSEYVEKLEDLKPALARALQSGQPSCVNVMTTATDIAPVTRRFVGAAANGPDGRDGKTRIPLADILEV